MKSKGFFVLLVIVLLFSCNHKNEEEKKLLKQAFENQQEAIALMQRLADSLKGAEYHHKDSLLEVIHTLEEGLFAIPGYDLVLEGHEGHDHGDPNVALSISEIVAVHEELLKQLKQIQTLLRP
ncbi:hypothetical protein [Roseivirga misakiensis]|uniref:Uncharacterized protein n=1 Tax=Roseivirga misakiensis TaxID=1563681 RepID=A0A1E5SY10_9BACT|nr:hypothetical protein [Roseivirga misakiensis]OEK04011.1 hypothetical protein BFP71_10975 [Roseivirga misakiensis]